MNTRLGWGILVGLTLVIVVLAVVLFVTPASVSAPTVPSEASEDTSIRKPEESAAQPLHTKVSITSPKSGATVGKTFVVAGSAPGNWFFEGSFPVQVRDKDNSKIGQGVAQAQGEWMTTDLVTFTTNITVSSYSGPATLVLLRDNPSGLPENDDALEIPITIQ